MKKRMEKVQEKYMSYKWIMADVIESIFIAIALIIQLNIEENLWQILMFVFSIAFIQYTKGYIKCKNIGFVFSVFLSFTLVIGKNYYMDENISYLLSRPMRTGILLLGNAWLVIRIVNLLTTYWINMAGKKWSCKVSEWLFGNKCFFKIGMLLLVLWTPVIILSFPGNMNADAVRQIEQVLGIVSYSSHHPLFSTLLIGGCIKIGYKLFGSYDVALFAYIWLQSIALAFSLSTTIYVLKKKGRSHIVLLSILSVYVFSPVYSNITSTVIKDVPFMVAVIWYIILWTEICTNFRIIKNRNFLLLFFITQILVALLRNNGIYMLAISHLIFLIIRFRELLVERKIVKTICVCLLPIFIGVIINSFLFNTLNAYSLGKREMLSLPLQMTARYLTEYENEITAEEKEIIDVILTDTPCVVRYYNPQIADPIKNLYNRDASLEEHVQYFKLWARWFLRHPRVYIDAFLVHVYGWFCPLIPNEIRYEAESDIFNVNELFPGSDKMLVDFYKDLDKIGILGILENVGIYTWIMLILSNITWKSDRKKITIFFPLYASLLICMLSPCFFMHPRYAFPIMFTVPFLLGFLSPCPRSDALECVMKEG